MKLGLQLGYWGAQPPSNRAALIAVAEDAGFDTVFTAEAWGSDAFTPLAWWGSSTSRIRLGTSIVQLSARTPTACAMASLTLDHLSGGRHVLGLGVSGPQVVEGWYGQRFPEPLARTREYIDIIRQVWAREKTVTNDGPHYPLPLTGEGTSGLGKALKPITHPLRADIPILLGAEGPRNVALAAEIGDGWLPIFYSPRMADTYSEWLDEGFARPGARHTRESFEICTTANIVITDDRSAVFEAMRPYFALYLGGMGADDTNYHADVFRRMGYGDVIDDVTKLFRAGKRTRLPPPSPTNSSTMPPSLATSTRSEARYADGRTQASPCSSSTLTAMSKSSNTRLCCKAEGDHVMTSEVLVVIGVGGMGQAIARRQGPGKTVLLADFNQETLELVASSMSRDGHAVHTLHVDVSSPDSVDCLARRATELGPVTQLVHTAGLSPAQASAESVLRVDLLGVALVLDAFGKIIAPGGAGVVVASMAGYLFPAFTAEQERALAHTPAPELLTLPHVNPGAVTDSALAYGLAKRANHIRVQSASMAWGRRGARVNSISPGCIATPMGHLELASPIGDGIRGLVAASATGRLGTPDEIAAAAAFLLGPDAAFITGVDLLVDGGVVAALQSGVAPRDSGPARRGIRS